MRCPSVRLGYAEGKIESLSDDECIETGRLCRFANKLFVSEISLGILLL